MRLTITPDTIKLETKPFVLHVNPLQFQEKIKYLHSHMKSGTILPHVEGIYFKSNVEAITFHADYAFKQKVMKMATDDGMGQEEFLLRAVQFYMGERQKTSFKLGMFPLATIKRVKSRCEGETPSYDKVRFFRKGIYL